MTGAHETSLNGKISKLAVGERLWLETELHAYASIQRRVSVKSRRPMSMTGMEFKCGLFTAVSASQAGDISYLVSIERTL